MEPLNGIFYRNTNREKDIYGFVECTNKTIDIAKFDENVRPIHGDYVKVDPNANIIVEIIDRTVYKLVGVLNINSKVSLGMTKNKSMKRKFFPYNNKMYHTFSVSSKKKYQANNVYAVIKINGWEEGSKYPTGILERIIGDVGDKQAELECIRIINDVKWKKYNEKEYQKNINEYSQDPHFANRIDITHLNCFSIDPPGCVDIDDVLSIEHFDNDRIDNIIRVGIHIADVSSFIVNGSNLDSEAFKRTESVYFPTKQYNMLPNILGTNIISLHQDKKRRAFTVFIKFKNNNIIDVEFVKTLIINKKKISYDECESILKNTNNEYHLQILDLFNLGHVLFTKSKKDRIELNVNSEYNSHMMVETFMVLANSLVAKKLIESDKNTTILRKHSGLKEFKILTDNPKNDKTNKDAIKMMNIKKINAASYDLFNVDNPTFANHEHKGLGQQFYTHFTSPIRRYFDILVHRQLWNAVDSKRSMYDRNDLDSMLNSINVKSKQIKNSQRQALILDKIFKIVDNNCSLSTTCTIIGFGINSVDIFVDELGIDIRCKIVPDKLLHMATIEHDELAKKIKIINKKGHECQLSLLDLVDINLIISKKQPYVLNKILIEMINPNINLFIR